MYLTSSVSGAENSSFERVWLNVAKDDLGGISRKDAHTPEKRKLKRKTQIRVGRMPKPPAPRRPKMTPDDQGGSKC